MATQVRPPLPSAAFAADPAELPPQIQPASAAPYRLPTFNAYELSEPGITVRDLASPDPSYSLQLVRIEGEGAVKELLHKHDEGFSLAYVLSGWLRVEFQEIGTHDLTTGTVVPAFNGPTHRERAAGDGLELLLLVTPKNLRGSEGEKIVLQFAKDAPYGAGPGFDVEVRDFALDNLTGGRMSARAVRATKAAGSEAGQWLAPRSSFQAVYVAEGWLAVRDGKGGEVRLGKGAAYYPAGDKGEGIAGHSGDLLAVQIVEHAGASGKASL
ncbi:hypothetical protein DFJ74DRAFT_501106 [Hyaloraphidium curvatum]|nr:hypothetical protein DFJ74DRAFT_501106 [Hyaloraphidium curvatum]